MTTETATKPPGPTRHHATPAQISLDHVRHLGVIPLFHATKPSAAGVLGCSRDAVYRLANDGTLPTIQLSQRRKVVPVAAFLRWLGETAETDAE